MRRVNLIILALMMCVSAWPQIMGGAPVSPTRYDYSQVAEQIVDGCTTPYDKAYAIYRWLCDNISYDTSFSIYTADECWDNRRGVCQAYSELFYRLGEAVGLQSIIVTGDARPSADRMDGHAWIFAIVDGNNAGIMIDPTWGAGSVNGTVFTRNEHDDTWFNVDPYWLIFTHYPSNEQFQLLPQPISRSQFEALPAGIKPFLGKYGFDAKTMFDRCIDSQIELPMFYNSGVDVLRFAEIPLQNTLRVGESYRFAVQKLKPCDIAIVNNAFYKDWTLQGDTYYYDFVPTTGGELSLMFNQGQSRTYTCAVQYNVAQPTAADLARLENANPYAMPEVTRLANFDQSLLIKFGIDGTQLLAAVRRGEVTELPTFYSSEAECSVDEMPLNGTLHVGRSYTFTLRPRNGVSWALINGGEWMSDWEQTDDGAITMTVTPKSAGQLVLAAQVEPDGSYQYCILFNVVN